MLRYSLPNPVVAKSYPLCLMGYTLHPSPPPPFSQAPPSASCAGPCYLQHHTCPAWLLGSMRSTNNFCCRVTELVRSRWLLVSRPGTADCISWCTLHCRPCSLCRSGRIPGCNPGDSRTHPQRLCSSWTGRVICCFDQCKFCLGLRSIPSSLGFGTPWESKHR